MEEQKKKKKGGCCLAVLIVMLVLVVGVLGIAAYGYTAVLNQINRFEEEEVTLSQEEIEAIENETEALPSDPDIEIVEDVTMPEEEAELIESDDHIINILLIGQDRRPGQGRQRSDSMILCTIDTKDKTLVMTSFLRDMYVDIPDWNGSSYLDNRLNVCYALGGMGMLDAALQKNFGIQVDHNIEVDFSGFKEIIGVFGGVSINLTKAEANYLGQGLVAGPNWLTPEQALNYSRIRYIDSDFGRTNRQRNVLNALLNSVKDMNTSQLTELVNKILPMITTDMTNSDITNYMIQVLPVLSQLEVTTQHIPIDGSYRNVYIRGMAVLVPDMEVNKAHLRDTLS